MSTRCQIAFISVAQGAREERWVYRHWDGYPEEVLPDVEEFVTWNAGGMLDVEYAAANFLFWSKLRAVCEERGDAGEASVPVTERAAARAVVRGCGEGVTLGGNVGAARTGFGVCLPGEFHRDIEYFYEVVSDEHGTVVLSYAVASGRGVSRDSLRLLGRAPP